jgi:very-short-patch-repair endonuclease
MNRARSLRKKATEAERILAGYKFRRQHPVDCYILDFYCPGAKVAIELDGGGHNYRAGQIHDRMRSERPARRGIAVLRFWNHQVRQELDSVLQAIWLALQSDVKTNPHLSPLPLAKGEAIPDPLTPSEITGLCPDAYSSAKLTWTGSTLGWDCARSSFPNCEKRPLCLHR